VPEPALTCQPPELLASTDPTTRGSSPSHYPATLAAAQADTRAGWALIDALLAEAAFDGGRLADGEAARISAYLVENGAQGYSAEYLARQVRIGRWRGAVDLSAYPVRWAREAWELELDAAEALPVFAAAGSRADVTHKLRAAASAKVRQASPFHQGLPPTPRPPSPPPGPPSPTTRGSSPATPPMPPQPTYLQRQGKSTPDVIAQRIPAPKLPVEPRLTPAVRELLTAAQLMSPSPWEEVFGPVIHRLDLPEGLSATELRRASRALALIAPELVAYYRAKAQWFEDVVALSAREDLEEEAAMEALADTEAPKLSVQLRQSASWHRYMADHLPGKANDASRRTHRSNAEAADAAAELAEEQGL
jgi:hypothetical protein